MRQTMTRILARVASRTVQFDYDASSDTGDEFHGDDFEFVAAHRLHRGLVHGLGVEDVDFVFGQVQVFSALRGGLHLFGQLDPFVDPLLSGDGSVVVGGQYLLQHLAEGSRLDDVLLATLLDLVLRVVRRVVRRRRCSVSSHGLRRVFFIKDKIEMSSRVRPAAVNTSMVSSSTVIAFEMSCRRAWSRSS